MTGELIPGAVLDIEAWATRMDVSQMRKIEQSGSRSETLRDWRIRWDRRIALSRTDLLEVEENHQIYTVVNMVEVTANRTGADLRRKFIDLSGVRSS